jgi:hypothetical protein
MTEAVGRIPTGVEYWTGICRRSGSYSVVVVQQSAETLTSLHFSALADDFGIRADQLVLETLMVAFAVVQLNDTTPILGISVKSATRGIHGMGERYVFMPLS